MRVFAMKLGLPKLYQSMTEEILWLECSRMRFVANRSEMRTRERKAQEVDE
jgi:hypothetical protein